MENAGNLKFDQLKARQREVRETFPESLALRTHRSLSWLGRSEKEQEDHDARFMFLWIAFNAAYANELPTRVGFSERRLLFRFLKKLIALDKDNLIYELVWSHFPSLIRGLLDNQYVFQPFWDHQCGRIGEAEWQSQFAASKRSAARALGKMKTERLMAVVFDRLYVLRNQIVHGGSTWNSAVNRSQVNDGANILGLIVPILIHLMLENPNQLWGEPTYPVV